MRRSVILFLVVVVAMSLVVALPASAGNGKPDCDPASDGYTPEHPSCTSDETPVEPVGATMCDPADWPDGIEGVQDDDFSFTLSGKQDGACIDVISDKGPWKVTIEGHGARALGVFPRDSSSPGDSCGGWNLRHGIYEYAEVGDQDDRLVLGYDGSIPAATINACGIEFGEWVDSSLVEPGLCTDTIGDQCFVEEKVDVTHPLVLLTFLSGSARGETTISVELP